MKKNLLLGAMLLVAGTLLADSKDDVVTAAKALGDKDNYSWKSTIEFEGGGNFRPGPTEGKTEKGGATFISSSFGDNTIESVLKGKKGAVKTDDGWQTVEELTGPDAARGPNTFAARRLMNFKAPAAEAQDLAEKTKSLKTDEGVISGDLTEEAVKARLTFGGRRGGNAPEISNPKGSVKFWVKDGVVTKYVVHVQGTVSFNGNDRDIDTTTTVEIKDIGSTKVTIPEEAAKKLS